MSLAAGDASVIILNASADGVEPALLVTASDGSQYLFHVPEGFARLALECKIRPTGKFRACFATDCTPSSLGGLTGLILRLSTDGHERFAVVGPSGACAEVAGAHKCARWLHPTVEGVELSPNSKYNGGIGCYADRSLTVWPVFLGEEGECVLCEWEKYQKTECNEVEHDHEDGGISENSSTLKKRSRASSPLKVDTDNSTVCVGYVCEMRVEGSSPGVRFMVINLKDYSLIDKMITNPTLSCFLGNSHAQHPIRAIFHFTTDKIVRGPKYLSWMEKMNCEHFICRVPYELGYRASARTSLRLSVIDSYSFPVPQVFGNVVRSHYEYTQLGLCASVCIRSGQKKCSVDHHTLRPDDFNPQSILSQLAIEHPDLSEAAERSLANIDARKNLDLEETETTPNVCKTSQQVAQELKSTLMQNLKGEKKRKAAADPEIIFLGTGSAEPNKYRGSSGILVELPHSVSEDVQKSWILLDCGEGTLGSMCRIFGEFTTNEIVKNLKMVWISHHHADHMLGIRGLLDFHARVCSRALTLIGPTKLKELLDICKFPENCYRFMHSRHLFNGPFGRFPPPPPSTTRAQRNDLSASGGLDSLCFQPCMNLRVKELAALTGLSRIEAIPVEHCRDAAAIVLASPSGWSLAYSGDGRPSHNFANAAKHCMMMIHEATFDDHLVQHALHKRHSTTSEAIHVALAAQVKYVILTHFSQRYPKAIDIENVEFKPIVAFDGLRLRYSQLDRMLDLQGLIATVNACSA